MPEPKMDIDFRHARNNLKRCLDEFDRYDKNTVGHNNAKMQLPRYIDELIQARITQALEALKVAPQ